MNLATMMVVFRKELMDLFRDRRTLISLVIAPMLVGPVIMSVMNYYIRRNERQAKIERFKVGIRQDVQIAGLREALDQAGLERISVDNPRQSVEKKDVTFGIEVTGKSEKPTVRFYSDNSEMTTSMARARVNEALEKVLRLRVRSELARHNLPESVAEPFSRESINVAQPRQMTAAFIGRMIGFLMLIFLFNGAMYSAVDATAGEKERRTLEILLSSAAGRTEIVMAKVMAALTTSFGTTALSLASYAFAFSQTTARARESMMFPTDPATIALILLLIIPVAIMAASVSVAAATPAKSTREAMSYLTPGLFVVMFLGMTTFIVEGEGSSLIHLLPFANFSQTLREVLSGDWTWSRYLTAFGANLVYSAIAISLAVRSFTNEKILFRT